LVDGNLLIVTLVLPEIVIEWGQQALACLFISKTGANPG